jgi:hypothetical protein
MARKGITSDQVSYYFGNRTQLEIDNITTAYPGDQVFNTTTGKLQTYYLGVWENTGFSDAPVDGKVYGRKNTTWVEVSTSGDSVTGDRIFEGDVTVDGTLTINGDIIQNGDAYETHAEKIYTRKDLIITRDKAISALAPGAYTGIQAKKYDGTNDGQLVFDRDGIARVGDVGALQPLATREESPNDFSIPYWNDSQNRFETEDIFDYNPSTDTLRVPNVNTTKIIPTSDSTSAIQITKANGITSLLTIDTINEKILDKNGEEIGSGGGEISGILGETIAVGQPAYLNTSDNKWYLAQAIESKVSLLSICSYGGDEDDTGKFVRYKNLTGLSGFTANSNMYLSQTTPGEIIYTMPTSGIVAYLGASKTTTSIDVAIALVAYSTENQSGSGDVTGGGIAWEEVTSTSDTAEENKGYITNNNSLVTITLPATCALGSVIALCGKGSGGWKIAQNAGQTIHFINVSTTTGVSGYIESTSQYDALEMVCVTANTTFVVRSSVGTVEMN